MNTETAGQKITFRDIHKHFQSLLQSQVSLVSQVSHVVQFVLLMPATNAVSERSASAMHRIKTYLRTTTTQSRLNNIVVLHIHRDLTDKVDHTAVLKEFVSANDDRRRHRGGPIPPRKNGPVDRRHCGPVNPVTGCHLSDINLGGRFSDKYMVLRWDPRCP